MKKKYATPDETKGIVENYTIHFLTLEALVVNLICGFNSLYNKNSLEVLRGVI